MHWLYLSKNMQWEGQGI